MVSLYRGYGTIGCSNLYLMWGNQLAEALYHLNLILFEKELNALAHAVGHPATARYDCRKVGFDGAINHYAVFGCMVRVLVHRCALKQRLGWDTSPV